MATFTRHFSAETRSFYYRRCHVSISERYTGYDNQGFPSYFDVMITKPRVATAADLLMLQEHPAMKDFFAREGNTIYYYDLKDIHFECLSNLPLFSIRTMKWAIEKTKEIIDEKYV